MAWQETAVHDGDSDPINGGSVLNKNMGNLVLHTLNILDDILSSHTGSFIFQWKHTVSAVVKVPCYGLFSFPVLDKLMVSISEVGACVRQITLQHSLRPADRTKSLM
jgi:hypothetical protein